MLARSGVVAILLVVAACASAPRQAELPDYRARAETQVKGGLRVSAAVLSLEETRLAFALPLAERGVQPVWLEIENREDKGYVLMVLSVDPGRGEPGR